MSALDDAHIRCDPVDIYTITVIIKLHGDECNIDCYAEKSDAIICFNLVISDPTKGRRDILIASSICYYVDKLYEVVVQDA